MKFAMSYSCGKDSALALYRMLKEADEAVALIATVNGGQNRSWFHGVDYPLLDAISTALEIPMIKSVSGGDDYREEFISALESAKEMGAEACAFGDIDIQQHFDWCTEAARAAGLAAVFPLWREDREKLVGEVIDLGFEAIVKTVDLSVLDRTFLGERLTRGLVGRIAERGADACGENGEYHTLVVDGPIFARRVPVAIKEYVDFQTHGAVNIVLAEE